MLLRSLIWNQRPTVCGGDRRSDTSLVALHLAAGHREVLVRGGEISGKGKVLSAYQTRVRDRQSKTVHGKGSKHAHSITLLC